MTKESYIRMTDTIRKLTSRLPGTTAWLRLPTYICASAYMVTLIALMISKDIRLIRVLLVPAICFAVVTALRPLINRQRPYDRFAAAPVGSYHPGKGKSMPSRHAASAAAIAIAAVYAFPSSVFGAAMLLLCLLIAALRVLSGQHYISDVVAALLLSTLISLVGYSL